MSERYLELGQLRCWDKGQRGNIYKTAKNAKRQASRFRRERPEAKNVRWYRCRWCGWYHLGSRQHFRLEEEEVGVIQANDGWRQDPKYDKDWFRDMDGCSLMLVEGVGADGDRPWWWEVVSQPGNRTLTGIVRGDVEKAKRVAERACGLLKELVAKLENADG